MNTLFFCEINMNSLSVSLIHFECTIFSLNQYKFTICIAISIWKHYLFRAFAFNPLFTAKSQWIHYLLRVSPWIHNFFENWPSVWRISGNHYEPNMKSPWFIIDSFHYDWHYLLRDFTLNSLSHSRNNFEYTICFANWFCVLRIFYEITIWIAISLWIHYP